VPTEPTAKPSGRDVPGMLMAVIFIVIAAAALWDTTSMTDSDSYVFPRAIALAMIAFCIALIVWNLLRPQPGDSSSGEEASTPRRIGLIVAMLAGTLLMPWLGFLLSGLLTFAALMLCSMYDTWTRFRAVVYPLAGIGIVIGFYTIFAKVLLVPLPVGLWFE